MMLIGWYYVTGDEISGYTATHIEPTNPNTMVNAIEACVNHQYWMYTGHGWYSYNRDSGIQFRFVYATHRSAYRYTRYQTPPAHVLQAFRDIINL